MDWWHEGRSIGMDEIGLGQRVLAAQYMGQVHYYFTLAVHFHFHH